MMANLLSNALKFTSKNPKPKIHFGSEVKENKIVYFVKDNGVGFNQKYVGKIFNEFQRLHTKSEFEGTSIGLAIVTPDSTDTAVSVLEVSDKALYRAKHNGRNRVEVNLERNV